MEDMEFTMNFDTIRETLKEQDDQQRSSTLPKNFTFNIKFLDTHIQNIQSTCEASFSQISLAAITTIGFILAHGGIKDTSLYFLDLSSSGTGKSHNLTLQFNLLLQDIVKLQENLQLNCDNEDEIKRFHNIHRGKITVPALNQCIRTVPAQLVVIDELGLLMQRGDDIIDEITKLYGASKTSLSITKSEIPNSKNIMPVRFSFMGATTLSYLGGSKVVNKHLQGGFINRSFISYNTILKTPNEITSIYNDTLDYKISNKQAMNLYSFAKTCNVEFKYSEESINKLLEFKKEIQSLRIKYHEMGTEFGTFYTRMEQNTRMLINIIHSLKCFELNTWTESIDISTINIAIDFVKKIVFKELDSLIYYLTDGELLEREEKQKTKIKNFVEEFFTKNNKMPKIRDLSLKTRLSKSEILDLTKDYLEIVPGTSIFKFCDQYRSN
jgi:hypothetical protein